LTIRLVFIDKKGHWEDGFLEKHALKGDPIFNTKNIS